ncbi:MAG: hypothetical protein EOO51_12720 [Flavobacterium sp.]|nr:MAG: hypothetical protein EOO51_12720 [Flavobacterium sp.]
MCELSEDYVGGLWFIFFSVLVFAGMMIVSFLGVLVIGLAESYQREKNAVREMCPHLRLNLKRKKSVKPYACAFCGLRF